MFLLYIDPGTGSMLFSILIGVVSTALFFGQRLLMKLKFILRGGKQRELDKSHLGIVIYSDSKRYWNVFGPIAREFESRKVPLIYYTQSPDDPALGEKFEYVKAEFIGEGNKGFAKLNLLNADVCLSTTPGLDVLQWKRSKNCKYYVHVPHTVDDLSGYRMFGLDFYDAVLTTGQNQIDLLKHIETLRPNITKKEFVTVGSPILDSLSLRLSESNRNKQEQKKDRTVLLAPSWGKEGILSKFGSDFISALQATGFKIIVRPHPQTVSSEKAMLNSLMEQFPESEKFNWNFDNDNFEVLNKADILITDFSGIIFDYSLVFDKPLIYADTQFDSGVYDAAWLDEPMWSFRVLPKVGIQLKKEDFSRIGEIITKAFESEKLKQGRESVRSECWQHRGESAKLIADYLIEKQKRGF
ncbi:MAG: CDP-glycerol glycerophosphotransferase family protein [Treponema sp.]|nr:CDP-glycerol glycerophosphotransferase family protein [Treponema sp.]